MAIDERFAYETFRPEQKELAERIRVACLNGGVLISEATSGFGKTAAVLAGALSAAEEIRCKVVYTSRTKRQINRVVEEVSRLQQKHLFKAAPLLSKFDYCLLRRQRAVPQESFGVVLHLQRQQQPLLLFPQRVPEGRVRPPGQRCSEEDPPSRRTRQAVRDRIRLSLRSG